MSFRGRTSPAKSEPAARASPSLLKHVLTRSAKTVKTRTSRRLSSVGADSSGNSTVTAALSDITNMSSADSTMNNTDVKKIAALALFNQKQNDVTPRTAIEQFLDANQSDAQTPAVVFNRGPMTRKRKIEEALPVLINKTTNDSKIDSSKIDADLEESNDVSAENSSYLNELPTARRRSKRRSNVEVTMDDVNPDKDLTRPTNLSTTVNMTDLVLSDDSTATDGPMLLSRKAKKKKTSGKKYFADDDFNLTRKEDNKTVAQHNETTLGKSLAQLNDISANESEMIDERMEKKRKMLEKRAARKKTAVNWDFSGIEPPSPKPTDSDQVSVSDKEQVNQIEAPQLVKPFDVDEDDTVPLPSEDNTLVQSSTSSHKMKVRLDVDAFEDITVTRDLTKEATITKPDQFSVLKNTLSPRSNIASNEEETIENIQSFVEKQVGGKVRRKSVYEGGLPELPVESSMLLEQTNVFRPGIESTRIAESSIDNNLSVKSPTSYPMSAKPGRDTSTPMEMKSFREGLRNKGLSKSTMPLIAEADALPKLSKTVNPTTEIDPHLPTPQIMEVIREARKSGMRSMRVSVYDKIPQDNVDGGTQTSPAVNHDNLHEEILEAGCQVTPGLEFTAGEPLMSQRNLTGAGFVSAGQIPMCEVTEVAEDVEGVVNDNVETKNTNDSVDSLNEEVAIELQAGVNVDNVENLLDITESGRKNPSPVTERRNEVEEESMELASDDNVEPVDDGESPDADPSLEHLRLPATNQTKTVPSSKEQKELRQATLARYLGVNNSTLSPLMTPTQSPPALQQETKKQKSKAVTAKSKAKTVFPAKNIKFEFQRFSRYKMKTEAEKSLVETSEEFISKCMSRMTQFAAERDSSKIHLCDIKRMMVECGFVKSSEEDPKDLDFFQEIRDIARDSLRDELIPCDYGAGKVHPPKDIWDMKGGKVPRMTKEKNHVATGTSKRKADSVTRFKAQDLNNTHELAHKVKRRRYKK